MCLQDVKVLLSFAGTTSVELVVSLIVSPLGGSSIDCFPLRDSNNNITAL